MTNAIEQIAARLERLHPRLIDLSLDRLQSLLARLDHPEKRLPPIVHVAGTNGKGSTCAFVRSMAEAAGQSVHVYTSPHLVRFNERIRLAGALISDDRLIAALERVEQINDGAPITVFEVITATAFDLFAATPADLCVLEVGLGGRCDATNVIKTPAACAITSISLDHRDMLGSTIEIIASEKAGIIKAGIPVAIGKQDPGVQRVLLAHAATQAAPVLLRGRDWDVTPASSGLHYNDTMGSLDLPRLSLQGLFQLDNAGIAIAALRATELPFSPSGLAHADWPARLQKLEGRLARLLPSDWELWLDGGHNPGAGVALAEHIHCWRDRPLHLVVGLNRAKDAAEFLRPLLPLAATVWAVQEPNQYSALTPEEIIVTSSGIARPGPRVEDALHKLRAEPGPARVLMCGSLYFAGAVLRLG